MKNVLKFPIFLLMSIALVKTTTAYAQDKITVTTPQHIALTSNNPLHLYVYETIQEYVQTQTQGYPGKVKVEIQPLDSRIRLGECDVMEAFSLQGSRLWGKTHIGVRCIQSVSKPWTIYVQTDVQVWGDYAVTALPVSQGNFVQAKDVVMQKGDLTKQPNGIITDISVLEGKQAALNLPLGTVLRPELLKAIPVVLQGQSVKLNSRGQGFVVSADGVAMNTANAGQLVDVKVANGQTVKGIAQGTGVVEVNF